MQLKPKLHDLVVMIQLAYQVNMKRLYDRFDIKKSCFADGYKKAMEEVEKMIDYELKITDEPINRETISVLKVLKYKLQELKK